SVVTVTVGVLAGGETVTTGPNAGRPQKYIISDATGLICDVLPDPPNPADLDRTISIADASVTEGTGAGLTFMTFTVSRTGLTFLPAAVSFSTADGTATGGASCTPGVDYISQPSGTAIFLPSATTATIAIRVCRDAVVEPNETFFVNLTGSTPGFPAYVIIDNQGQGTINNDD
ncbi:MAG: hypothetical protein KIT87_27465, partial [Anaerolineae bacterium]|nr:hypothetical protein [Anaerolineae bacterium]